MSDLGILAPPTSRRRLRSIAREFRRRLALERDGWFPVMEVLERAFPRVSGFDFHIGTVDAMGSDHGLTVLREREVWIREDVYERACEHYGRDRMTVAHEMAHALLHADVTLARSFQKPKPYQDPEWQAKAFAGELLLPHWHITLGMTPALAARVFGVSLDAARFQLDTYRKERLISNA